MFCGYTLTEYGFNLYHISSGELNFHLTVKVMYEIVNM